MEDKVDGTGMVLNEQPVAHILTLTIDRQRLAMADVIDEQRNQLLRELIGAVVVGTVGDNNWHAIGVMEGANKVVA